MELQLVNRRSVEYAFFWNGPFSQWFKFNFEASGIKFNSAEQYMMYHKAQLFGDHQMAKKILESSNQARIKEYGRRVKGFDETVWNEHKFQIVKAGNIFKFREIFKDKEFAEAFEKQIGERLFVEASPYDKIWGVGLHWSDNRILDKSKWLGQNLLGKAIDEALVELKIR